MCPSFSSAIALTKTGRKSKGARVLTIEAGEHRPMAGNATGVRTDMAKAPDDPGELIHVGKPNIGDRQRFLDRLSDALDRQLLSNGPLVREFEERVASLAGVDHCVAVCNATTGLQVVAKAYGIGPRDEVIMPAFTWVATPHAMEWIGAVPVFCDIDPRTATIDPEHVRRLVTPRTRGIVGVHVYGVPCDTDALDTLSRDTGLPVFYDAAHAFGNTHLGRPIGGFGEAEVFSFHATKFLNSFEGGAVVTNDADLAERLRATVNFGLAPDRQVLWSGTNAKMTEVCAAMGLTSLEAMPELISVNRRNDAAYRRALGGIPGVRVRPQAPGEGNHQYVVVEIDPDTTGIHRDDVNRSMHARGILTRPYFSPGCHQFAPYRATSAHAPLPNTEALAERVLSLPNGTSVGLCEVTRVANVLRHAVDAPLTA